MNKIILKFTLDEDTSPPKKLLTITDKQRVTEILSAIKHVKCMEDFILTSRQTELWLYENSKLRLKVALAVDENSAITSFYRPKQGRYKGPSLGGPNDFLIVDEKLCSWLDEIIKKHLAAQK